MTSRKPLLLAFLWAMLVFVFVHFIDFPGSVPDFKRASGGGESFDVKPAFSEDAIYQRLSGYGDEGRKNYSSRNITVDVLLPLSLLPFLILWMLSAMRPLGVGRVTRGVLLSFALLYVLFDLAENGVVLALLSSFPERMHGLASALPYLTVIKRVASMLAMFLPLLLIGRQKYSRRRATNAGIASGPSA